jgi:hypothetical protein
LRPACLVLRVVRLVGNPRPFVDRRTWLLDGEVAAATVDRGSYGR